MLNMFERGEREDNWRSNPKTLDNIGKNSPSIKHPCTRTVWHELVTLIFTWLTHMQIIYDIQVMGQQESNLNSHESL